MHSHLLNLHATSDYLGIISISLVIIAYILVVLEEVIELKKSKPVLVVAGIIWILVAIIAKQQNCSGQVVLAFKKNLIEYGELLLFLIVAITYINVMNERKIFEVLRVKLINSRFSLRQLFWITGGLAFFISPIADNLTTALVMSAIVIAVAPNNKKFISCACVNIVVAANAGGAFSPFGDLTTLMVWQSNKLGFADFFKLFIPALISFLIPASFMAISLDNKLPAKIDQGSNLKFGARRVVGLFLFTIILAVISNHSLQLPPVAGMMVGLGLLQLFGYYIRKHEQQSLAKHKQSQDIFDIFEQIKNLEWDTLLFFYGIIMCIGGLDALGYLEKLSNLLYGSLGVHLPAMHQQTPANILIGILSAIIDNIPLMFAVLTMDPSMSKWQWLLVTLTLGIGGSLLSIGSAAGVALMGNTKGAYGFLSHLKWSWAILLGYAAAILVHWMMY